MSSTQATVPTYTDLEIRILDLQTAGYPVELTVPDLQLPRGFLNPAALPLPWVPSADPASDGERLMSWLLANRAVKEAWDRAYGLNCYRRIRLRIDATAPELHSLPWEALRIPAGPNRPPVDLAADDLTPFSRYLALDSPPGSQIVDKQLRVLVAVADPTNLAEYTLDPIDREAELEALATAVEGLPVALTPLAGWCTLSAIEAALRRDQHHVLHIVANGRYTESAGASLYLANGDNRVQVASADQVAAMLDRLGGADKPALVFLGSCQTAKTSPADAFRGLAPRLLQAGIPAVLAMQDSVPRETYRTFAQVFYRQLMQHGMVDLAANQARAALLTANLPGADNLVLFMRVKDGKLLKVGATKNEYNEGSAADPINRDLQDRDIEYVLALAGDEEGLSAWEIHKATGLSEIDVDAYLEKNDALFQQKKADTWFISKREDRTRFAKELKDDICQDIGAWVSGAVWNDQHILGRIAIHGSARCMTVFEGVKDAFSASRNRTSPAMPTLNQAAQNLEEMLDSIRDAKWSQDRLSYTKHESNAIGNILGLLDVIWGGDLSTRDLSHLVIRNFDFNTVRLQDVDAERGKFENCQFRQTFGSVSALVFDKDNPSLIMGATNGEIRKWNPSNTDEREISVLRHRDTVRSLEIVRMAGDDRDRLLSAGDDGKVYLSTMGDLGAIPLEVFDFSKDSETKDSAKKPPRTKVLCATVSPDGQWIFAGIEQGQLKYKKWFKSESGSVSGIQSKQATERPGDWLVSAAFLSKTPQPPWRLVTGSQDGYLRLWEVSSAVSGAGLSIEPLTEVTLEDRLRRIVTDSNGRFVLAACEDSAIRIFEVGDPSATSGLNLIRTVHAELNNNPAGRVWDLVLSPNEDCLAAGTDDGMLRVWSLSDLIAESSRDAEVPPIAIGKGHSDRIWSIVFIDQDIIATGSDDQTIRFWSLEAKRRNLQPHKELRSELGYSNRVWTVAAFPGTGAPTRMDLIAYSGDFSDIQNGSGQVRDRIRVFHKSYRNHRSLKVRGGLAGRVEAVAWSGDGHYLAAASHGNHNGQNSDKIDKRYGGSVTVWSISGKDNYHDLELQDPRHLMLDQGDWAYSIAWHPSASLLAYGTRSGNVGYRSLAPRSPDDQLDYLFNGTKPVRSVTFNRTGDILAASTEGGQILFWRKNGKQFAVGHAPDPIISPKNGKPQPVRTVAFHPSDDDSHQFLVTGDDLKVIRVWRLFSHTDEHLAIEQIEEHAKDKDPNHHSDRIRAVAFSPDGEILASGDDDGRVLIWRWDSAAAGGYLKPLGELAILREKSSIYSGVENGKRVRSLSFFPDGDLCVCWEDEIESCSIWEYLPRTYESITPANARVASAVFRYSTSFHPHRLYEGFDCTEASFLSIDTESNDESDIKPQLEHRLQHLGAIEADKSFLDNTDRHQEIRKFILEEIQNLYPQNDRERWHISVTKEICLGFQKYFGPNRSTQPVTDRKPADNQELMDGMHYAHQEKLLRSLLNERRPSYVLFRSSRNADDTARFLLQLCFVLRKEDASDRSERWRSVTELEQRLLVGEASKTDPWYRSYWWDYRFFKEAVHPVAEDAFPEAWRDFRPTLKITGKIDYRNIPLPLFDEDSVLREDYDIAPRFLEFFTRENPTPLVHPKDKRFIQIACTILDETVRDPGTIDCRDSSDQFEFPENWEWLRLAQDRIEQKIAEEHPGYELPQPKARLSHFRKDAAQLSIGFRPVPYSCYLITNLAVARGARYRHRISEGNTLTLDRVPDGALLLDLLCPPHPADGLRNLPDLFTGPFSNHLGVDCITITSDGYLLMYRRLASELTDPGTIGFAPSIAMNFGQEAVATPQSSIARSFKRELRKPLEELHHPLRPVRPLLYLGTFREWARGGKPEMYFLTRSLKNRQEHVAYSQAHEGDSDKDKAPKTWMDGVEFLLHPHGFKMTESADVFRERLWNLTDTLQDSLQESAKGGIYLLSQAYKNAPGILRDFFVQFDNQP